MIQNSVTSCAQAITDLGFAKRQTPEIERRRVIEHELHLRRLRAERNFVARHTSQLALDAQRCEELARTRQVEIDRDLNTAVALQDDGRRFAAQLRRGVDARLGFEIDNSQLGCCLCEARHVQRLRLNVKP